MMPWPKKSTSDVLPASSLRTLSCLVTKRVEYPGMALQGVWSARGVCELDGARGSAAVQDVPHIVLWPEPFLVYVLCHRLVIVHGVFYL